MNRVKITVVKVSDFYDTHKYDDLGCSTNMSPRCKKFKVGQEFVIDMNHMPECFCPYAFHDIAPYIITLSEGGSYSWMNETSKVLVCCTDGFHPVFFRLERIEA